MTTPIERPSLDPEQFRRQAHEIVDWMADYLRDLGTRPVQPAYRYVPVTRYNYYD